MRIYFDLRLNVLKVSNDILLQNIASQPIVLQMARQEMSLFCHTACYGNI